MEHIYFDRYHAPVEKRFGDHGTKLTCWTAHTACLPSCANVEDDGKGCEFEDRFVHVSNWDRPETDNLFWAS